MTKTSIPYNQNNQEGIDKNIKENITSINNKEKEEDGFKKVLNFYENNITLITPYVAESINYYLTENNLEAELIIETMKEAVARNKRNWKYIESILKNCEDNNIKTAQQFKMNQEEFKTSKSQQSKKDMAKPKVEYTEVEMTEEEYKKKLYE